MPFGSFSACPGRGTRKIPSSAPLIRRTGRVQYPSSHAWAWVTHIMGHTVAGEGPISLPAWSIFLDFQRCRRLSQLCRLPSLPSALTFSRKSGWSVQQSSGGCSVLPQPLQGANFRTFVWCFFFSTSLRSGLRLAALPNFLGLEFVLEPLWCFVGMRDQAILKAISSLATCRAFQDGARTCAGSS